MNHYCINCNELAIQKHHVVPRELGGNDTTNCVYLCDKCHALVHKISYGNGQLSHSELTKLGLEKAKAEGRMGGRPKKWDENTIITIKQMRENKYTIKKMSEELNLSLATINRIIKFIKENYNI